MRITTVQNTNPATVSTGIQIREGVRFRVCPHEVSSDLPFFCTVAKQMQGVSKGLTVLTAPTVLTALLYWVPASTPNLT